MNIKSIGMKKLLNKQKISRYSLVVFLLLVLPSQSNAAFSYEIKSLIGPTTFEGLLVAILNAFIVIAIPIIVLFIIYSGFLYVTAKGNAEQLQQATRSLTYSIIGAVIIIGAVAIAEVIKNVVDAFAA